MGLLKGFTRNSFPNDLALCRKGLNVEQLKEQAKLIGEEERRRLREEREAALATQKKKQVTSPEPPTPTSLHAKSRKDSAPARVRHISSEMKPTSHSVLCTAAFSHTGYVPNIVHTPYSGPDHTNMERLSYVAVGRDRTRISLCLYSY
jgi:hypothetical protein